MTIKNKIIKKPKLVKVGKHYLNPDDVAGIKETRRGLYIVKLRSEPNPEWPIWVEEKHINSLLEHFEIVTDDSD